MLSEQNQLQRLYGVQSHLLSFERLHHRDGEEVSGCQKTQRKVGGDGCDCKGVEEGRSYMVVGQFSFMIVVMIT